MKTLEFQSQSIAERANPGQFLMVWIPGVDEKPMGFSYIGGPDDHWTIGVTVARVGKATEALQAFQNGDLLGLRGPFGNGLDENLFQSVQRNIGQQGGDHAPLWCTSLGKQELPTVHNASLEPAFDQTVYGFDGIEFGQEGCVRDAVEAFFGVCFQDILGFGTCRSENRVNRIVR